MRINELEVLYPCGGQERERRILELRTDPMFDLIKEVLENGLNWERLMKLEKSKGISKYFDSEIELLITQNKTLRSIYFDELPRLVFSWYLRSGMNGRECTRKIGKYSYNGVRHWINKLRDIRMITELGYGSRKEIVYTLNIPAYPNLILTLRGLIGDRLSIEG